MQTFHTEIIVDTECIFSYVNILNVKSYNKG